MAGNVVASIDDVINNPELAAGILALRRDLGTHSEVLTEEGAETPDEFNFASLAGVIYTSLNGRGDVPQQRVRVEYLSRDQFLVIPKALGINPADQALSEARHDNAYVAHYVKAAHLTYQQIWTAMNTPGEIAAKRIAYDALPMPENIVNVPMWTQPDYYRREGVVQEDPERISLTFGLLSRMLKINCDIRDMGALVGTKPYMRMEDGAWSTEVAGAIPADRMTSKLQPYSMQMLAALNMVPCSNFVIGAWVRSFGVSVGILPSRNTRLNKEWKFTDQFPTLNQIELVDGIHKVLKGDLNALCLNMIAMFGLLHLNKNHTYITGDASMQRICTSYINTLRTLVSSQIIEDLKNNMEVTCRTACHPLGLGQTYATAHILNEKNCLAAPLALRISVTPPLTQRLMIVAAAAAEWSQLPVGKTMARLHAEDIEVIKMEIAKIKTGAAYYSELHRYYGINDMVKVDPEVKEKADALMPVVGGYANVLHTGSREEKDGIALAMSFLNVNRDSRAVTAAYSTLWERYMDSLEEKELDEFMAQAFAMKKQATPSGST